MMAGNPNWWSMINGMHPQPQLTNSHHHFLYGNPNPNYSPPPPPSSSITGSNSAPDHHHHQDQEQDQDQEHDHHPSQDFPTVRSWSQLLLGGLGDERFGGNLFQQKRLENWEDRVLNNLNPSFARVPPPADHVKQEFSAQFFENHQNNNDQFHQNRSSWPHTHLHHPQISSPNNNNNSSTTPIRNSFLNFSNSKSTTPPPPTTTTTTKGRKHHHNQDHSSEGNSTSSGGVQPKKPRVQQSSAQPALKVRKEKLGDRITALHQLVSPFGKTDTASVLSEAIVYIRFLEAQIEALSSPYMRNGSGNNSIHHHQHSLDCEGGPGVKDLRSRGLCLVPTSCTQNVPGSTDHGGADYWAPPAYGGGASAF
ncbi:transcription factor bHLH68-like [Andrographis paniculata]|uniref:transcription factor bHLH68-like n=1 Tax=Andrographis paniculata TaxID=175694 RepID=UPI0021E9665D|nr:transcription factor bHLH68-like [Andrographis paniculata]